MQKRLGAARTEGEIEDTRTEIQGGEGADQATMMTEINRHGNRIIEAGEFDG